MKLCTEDLNRFQYGTRVMANGDVYIKWTTHEKKCWRIARGLLELTSKQLARKEIERVEVIKFVEWKKPILDGVEEQYLWNMMQPFLTKRIEMSKIEYNEKYCIQIYVDDYKITLPPFPKSSRKYEGMEAGKRYLASELFNHEDEELGDELNGD